MADISVQDPSGIVGRISDAEFAALRKLIYDQFGINLTEQKKTLVVGRLQKVLRDRGFDTFTEYFDWLRQDRSGEGLDELGNRISTNHTFFYREKSHFEFFQERVLPEATARNQREGRKELRIWCAGCSSGEEPYTLMMLMMDFLGPRLNSWRPVLLATDISATVLGKAMRGVYPTDRVSELPTALRNRYFQSLPEGDLAVVDAVRRNIHFRRHNLMDATFPFKKQFDAIFCRNVMIYFDRPTRNQLVAKYYRHTVPGGYLIIGHSETIGRDDSQYNYINPAVYQKPL